MKTRGHEAKKTKSRLVGFYDMQSHIRRILPSLWTQRAPQPAGGEGCNDKEESEEEESKEEEDDPRQKKIYSDIKITFNENPQRRGRGRSGRGRGEGRGGRGHGDDRGHRGGFDGGRGRGGFGGRGGRGGGNKLREAAPRFDDEADFPSLVKLAA